MPGLGWAGLSCSATNIGKTGWLPLFPPLCIVLCVIAAQLGHQHLQCWSTPLTRRGAERKSGSPPAMGWAGGPLPSPDDDGDPRGPPQINVEENTAFCSEPLALARREGTSTAQCHDKCAVWPNEDPPCVFGGGRPALHSIVWLDICSFPTWWWQDFAAEGIRAAAAFLRGRPRY